jgi:nucleotide-binding universal stress UspA family protein
VRRARSFWSANDDTPSNDRTRPVVVGVDSSPMSEGALAFGFAVASERGVPLVVVHAWRDLYIDALTGAALDWEAIETEEQEVLAQDPDGRVRICP